MAGQWPLVTGILASMKGDVGRPRIVIVGGGFGGLYAARELAHHPVEIIVIDRKNHHTFQPLLYQVATAVLSPGEIASPIRGILHRHNNVNVILGEVTGFDLSARSVQMREEALHYDYLIVASGATHSYFGHDEWEVFAPGLKTIEDALEIRRRVLLAYEVAERRALAGEEPEPLNFVVIGGGPTGVELAGALADIARHALARDFRSIDTATSRVILLEGAARVLPGYPPDLSQKAEQQLRRLGVEVRTSTRVTDIEGGQVWMGEEALPTAVVLWAAGVRASALGAKLGVPLDRAGRVLVNQDLSVPGHAEVFVVGDLAAFKNEDGSMLPGVAQVAMQGGIAAARNIWARVQGKPAQAFHYHDKGDLATIGRAAAVARLRRMHLSGWLAWVMWLVVHIFFLIGFRNRLLVMGNWIWAYFTRGRGIRLITGSDDLPGITTDVKSKM
jgi:NADH dehydrogenase